MLLHPNESILDIKVKIDGLEDEVLNNVEDIVLGGDFNTKVIEWGMPHTDTKGRLILELLPGQSSLS